jgi:isoleucyl-tRNA synthetase
MKDKYPEYRQLDLRAIGEDVKAFWEENDIFHKSLKLRQGRTPYVFYEGPPSANGIPGIHHVMARAIKDIFCRYKTQKGFLVERKAGWDTHGLPVEIGVEKSLGITKEDIGVKIPVAEYNQACRREVMKYKNLWDELTTRMGYWVDLDDPYITFDNKYIESVWHLLSQLYQKGLLYKGFSIQPYSPAAGTGLSTHELNQPGAYRIVKDSTVTAQFRVIPDSKSKMLFEGADGDVFILAWTTTPWTLPSNTALAVGAEIDYVQVNTVNPYTQARVSLILARERFDAYFKTGKEDEGSSSIVRQIKGSELAGMRYEQLLPYAQPLDGNAFLVVTGDFVTTEDGTGVVHIAPSFGADDFRTARQYGLGSLTLVDKQGKFTSEMGEFSGRFVKNEYDPLASEGADSVDVDIIVKLKKENKAFKTARYEHSYPHCWRTDKPILYYPLDSWFIRTTAYKDRMIELNQSINWKPRATGIGRFGNWLENLVDWNLSRSRYWGVPLPVWTSEDRSEQICIGSIEQLRNEIEKALSAGFMKSSPYHDFVPGDFSTGNYDRIDLHKPYVDEIVLVSSSGKPMYREPDLIDVWFDSGAMPYAQWHYPFENKEVFERNFPADFIAEGVDQTRGWFFTLHAIATMLFDKVAFKTCVSNGLVLDKEGNKMSKRLGNAVDPFKTIGTYGPDATRWYMITNAQPWDNLKFDLEGISEVQRKFFGTLYNTYAFFALYANIDGFTYREEELSLEQRPEIDRWILSELNTLIARVDEFYADYEPTRAGRAIADFVDAMLSNWYVRLSRRRFWKGEYSNDKISAYQTLYTCLETLARLMAPIAPFFADRLFTDLNRATGRESAESVHLTDFPIARMEWIDNDLEQRMELARDISSLVLSLRKRTNHRVRQPLQKILLPVSSPDMQRQVEAMRNLILSEVNVKELEFLYDSAGILVKKIKPDFKALGPRFGKQMKPLSNVIMGFSQEQIIKLEKEGCINLVLDGHEVEVTSSDVEISTEDIPGWVVSSAGSLTVALDITLSPELLREGLARELVNRIQNLRKDKGFEVTDQIDVRLQKLPAISDAVSENYEYICSETLANSFELTDNISPEESVLVELTEEVSARLWIERR